MKRTHYHAWLAAIIIAIPSAVYAQEVKPDTTPMTPEQIQKALLIKSGKYRPSYTPEEKAEFERKEKLYRQSLDTARQLYRNGQFAKAASVYADIDWNNRPHARWETAEAYRAAGQIEQAIKWYRLALYQKVKSSDSRFLEPSPRAKLSSNTIPLATLREQPAQEEIEVWADNDAIKIGQFVLLLAQHGEYDEAISAYNRALQVSANALRPEWLSALSLGNISPTNFDQRRFAATVYAMMAARGFSLDWMQLHYEEPKGKEYEQERYGWINEAIRVKPECAPALYIKADMITTIGETKSAAEYSEAKKCLDQAEQYARSEEMRTLIQKLRNDYPSRLR